MRNPSPISTYKVHTRYLTQNFFCGYCKRGIKRHPFGMNNARFLFQCTMAFVLAYIWTEIWPPCVYGWSYFCPSTWDEHLTLMKDPSQTLKPWNATRTRRSKILGTHIICLSKEQFRRRSNSGNTRPTESRRISKNILYTSMLVLGMVNYLSVEIHR